MAQHIGKAHRGQLRHGMRLVRHDGQVVAAVVARLQAAQVGGIPADADGRAALADALHHVGAHPLFHADLDAAVGRVLQERRHIIGQRFGHDRGRDQHAHMAPGAGGICGHVALDLPTLASMVRACSSSVSPAGVGTTPRRLRSRGVPTVSSSWASRLLMAEPTMDSCSATAQCCAGRTRRQNRRRVCRSRSRMGCDVPFGNHKVPKLIF